MPIENPLPSLVEWFFGPPWYAGAGFIFLAVVVALVVLALLGGCLVAALRYGPGAAVKITGKVLAEAVPDLVRMSPRRVWALTWLAVKESIRRRVVVVFAVFVVLLLFASWFLDPTSTDPARLYLSFVLTATSYLVLLLALFLSAFSLPADIRSRTLHTIVTKPVRASEIVLARILGFTLVGTALLGFMCAVSYVFVVRGLDHTHDVIADNLQPVAASPAGKAAGAAKTGYAEPKHGHRHRLTVDADGQARVEAERGHWHEVRTTSSGGAPAYALEGPEGMLLARVPVYGKLRFRDASGTDTEKGINVGDEWMYRSFIQGNSEAATIWTFENVTESRFREGLPIEMSIEVFRTYKGDIERGVLGSLAVRNPRTGLIVETEIFESKDFTITKAFVPRVIPKAKVSRARVVPRKIQVPGGGVEYDPPRESLNRSLADKREFDLFEDLVAGGEVEVWLQCLEPSQYFGASQPDLYLRAADAWFGLNFVKGYFGIWLQMVLVIGFGVMFSTFLSGPVAMLATSGALVGGFFSEFMAKLARREVIGGGPFEALIRLVNQDNLMIDLEPGLQSQVAQLADRVAEAGLFVTSSILPPFGDFSYANWVAYGFDILWNPYIAVPTLRTLAFMIPVFVAGYFFLKTREVAR
jgi:hypothetical protein